MLQAIKNWRRMWLLPYLYALVLVLIAFLARWEAVKVFGSALPPFITFYPMVLVVALLWGFGPGVLATTTASVVAEYWFLPPYGSLRLASPADGAALAIYFSSSIFMCLVAKRYRRFHEHVVLSLQREMELNRTRARMSAALDSCSDAILISDIDGRLTNFNDAFVSFCRFKNREECPKTFEKYPDIFEVLDDKGQPLPLSMWAVPRALQGESVSNIELKLRRKDTGEVWFGSYCFSPIRDAAGVIVGAVMTARDITERKKAEEALRASEFRYRTAFLTSPDSVNINRLEDGMYVDCNEGFLKITGYRREEVIGRTSLELNVWDDPNDRKRFVEKLKLFSTYQEFEARFRKKNGEVFWGKISASLMEIDGVSCLLSLTRDITDAKIAEEEIRNLAYFDPLTGLANRRLLMERLERSLVISRRSQLKRALLMVDLDNFKMLNDTLGHATGDLLLREAGQRLAGCARDADTVCRLGGDEFVLVLEYLSERPEDAAAQAKQIAESVLAEFERPFLLHGRESRCNCSIGITVFSNEQQNASEILQQADIAMYQAKEAGRGKVRFFAPALQAAVNARAALEEELRLGIKADQFALYYQPQIEYGRITGAEALVRWRHPGRGLLLPAEFIELAETTGLILPLGEWVLETACRQIAEWAKEPSTAHLLVAVNLSALQISEQNFVENVLATLDRTGADPRNLELELTESMLVEDAEDVIDKMSRLKAHGVRFSIDDFGTGYSSLTYLKRLPLDRLKIDRSFIRDILDEAGSRAIAQMIITLSRSMSLAVIAEGVETETQREMLAHLGCHCCQGYLFSKPLPSEAFGRLINDLVESKTELAGTTAAQRSRSIQEINRFAQL